MKSRAVIRAGRRPLRSLQLMIAYTLRLDRPGGLWQKIYLNQ
jgi:hypothetical protein